MDTKPAHNTKDIDLRRVNKPTKRQKRFMDAFFLDPGKDTFGNVYQSALVAGFSDGYARSMAAKSRGVDWIRELKALYTHLEPEHIYLGLQNKALNSRSDRDQIRALELMAKIQGMFIDRSLQQINVSFTNSVPRPVTDIEADNATPSTDK